MLCTYIFIWSPQAEGFCSKKKYWRGHYHNLRVTCSWRLICLTSYENPENRNVYNRARACVCVCVCVCVRACVRVCPSRFPWHKKGDSLKAKNESIMWSLNDIAIPYLATVSIFTHDLRLLLVRFDALCRCFIADCDCCQEQHDDVRTKHDLSWK